MLGKDTHCRSPGLARRVQMSTFCTSLSVHGGIIGSCWREGLAAIVSGSSHQTLTHPPGACRVQGIAVAALNSQGKAAGIGEDI